MEIEQVKKILKLLADGTDPFTGEIYPEGSPYHNSETIRALYEALLLIENSQVVVQKIKKPSADKIESCHVPQDKELFEKLREIRHLIASKAMLPSYCIFHNKILIAMSAAKPKNLSEMKCIKGIGNKNSERYGHIFLAVINGESPDNAIKLFTNEF